jgi:hypothetical protein
VGADFSLGHEVPSYRALPHRIAQEPLSARISVSSSQRHLRVRICLRSGCVIPAAKDRTFRPSVRIRERQTVISGRSDRQTYGLRKRILKRRPGRRQPELGTQPSRVPVSRFRLRRALEGS